tara:strand:+ start:221 stop:514 length:294 start_codon:yes stop_codon:yes gene_type:complete
MKIFKITIILIFFFSTNVYSAESDCSNIDKLSKEYAKCIADLAKKKGSEVKEKAKKKSSEVKEKITSDENKKKFSKFKDKLKKFGESKTGSEFFNKK